MKNYTCPHRSIFLVFFLTNNFFLETDLKATVHNEFPWMYNLSAAISVNLKE